MSGLLIVIFQCLFVNGISKTLAFWELESNLISKNWTGNGMKDNNGYGYVTNGRFFMSPTISTKNYISLNITITSPISTSWPIENNDACILMYNGPEPSNSRVEIMRYNDELLSNTFGDFDAKNSSTIVLSKDILDKNGIRFVWTANTTNDGPNDTGGRCYLINTVIVNGEYITQAPTKSILGESVFFVILGGVGICIVIIILIICIVCIRKHKNIQNEVDIAITSNKQTIRKVNQTLTETPNTKDDIIRTPGQVDPIFNNHDDDLLNNTLGRNIEGMDKEGQTRCGDDEFVPPPPNPPPNPQTIPGDDDDDSIVIVWNTKGEILDNINSDNKESTPPAPPIPKN